jgi:hypothetical protein
VIAALAIGYNRRFGWIIGIGIGVVVVSWFLYALQETVGLPGLSRTWWEPTRLMSLAFSVLHGCCSPRTQSAPPVTQLQIMTVQTRPRR